MRTYAHSLSARLRVHGILTPLVRVLPSDQPPPVVTYDGEDFEIVFDGVVDRRVEIVAPPIHAIRESGNDGKDAA